MKIGDKVTFKLTACNWPARRTTLVIRKVLVDGGVEVYHQGFTDFRIRPHEIIATHARVA